MLLSFLASEYIYIELPSIIQKHFHNDGEFCGYFDELKLQ